MRVTCTAEKMKQRFDQTKAREEDEKERDAGDAEGEKY